MREFLLAVYYIGIFFASIGFIHSLFVCCKYTKACRDSLYLSMWNIMLKKAINTLTDEEKAQESVEVKVGNSIVSLVKNQKGVYEVETLVKKNGEYRIERQELLDSKRVEKFYTASKEIMQKHPELLFKKRSIANGIQFCEAEFSQVYG